ncbi:hypothetical protein [Kitasatospora griseola]
MFSDLEQEQQDLLVAIGIKEDPALAQTAVVKKARKAAAAGWPKKASAQAGRFALGVARTGRPPVARGGAGAGGGRPGPLGRRQRIETAVQQTVPGRSPQQ